MPPDAFAQMVNVHQELVQQASEWVRQGGRIALERFRAHGRVAQGGSLAGHRCRPRGAGVAAGFDRPSLPCGRGDHRRDASSPGRHGAVASARRCWIIDPIDGTRSFARSFPGFGISVGLVEDGVPVVGLIYSPLTDQLYPAWAGGRGVAGRSPFACAQRAAGAGHDAGHSLFAPQPIAEPRPCLDRSVRRAQPRLDRAASRPARGGGAGRCFR